MARENSYVPNDPWCICDLSGVKVRMSQTKKTWDGLRVWEQYWYPKHPQLSVRGIPDHMEVKDARPRPTDVFTYPEYGTGTWTIASLNGTIWYVTVSNVGALVSTPTSWQPTPPPFYLDGYEISVSNAGVLSAAASTYTGPNTWVLFSPNGTRYNVTVSSGTITVTAA
jgi:hypothetical protein